MEAVSRVNQARTGRKRVPALVLKARNFCRRRRTFNCRMEGHPDLPATALRRPRSMDFRLAGQALQFLGAGS